MSHNDDEQQVDKAFDDVIKAKVTEIITARLGNSVHSYINKTQQFKLIGRINKLSWARDAENADSEEYLRVYLTTEEWINWYDKLLQAIIGVSTLGAGFAFGVIMSGTDARDKADTSLQNVRYFMSISWLLFVLSLGWASFTTLIINVNKRWFMYNFDRVLWYDKNNHLFSSYASFLAGTMTLIAQLFPIAAFVVSAKAVQVYYDEVGRWAVGLISSIGFVLIVFWVFQNNYHAICKPCHPKSISLTGTFTPTPTAAGLSSAPHFTHPNVPVPIIMVFSNSTGKPDTDLNAGPRGMRLRFNTGAKNTDIVAHSTPFFPTRTGKDLQAQAPTPYSYACLTYFSVTTIYFVNANGEKTAIRCCIVPDPPTESPSAEQPKDRTPHFLQDDIKKRVSEGPIGFKLLAQVAIVMDDNTKHWPSKISDLVELGTLSINKL